jgi:hypothetical protein
LKLTRAPSALPVHFQIAIILIFLRHAKVALDPALKAASKLREPFQTFWRRASVCIYAPKPPVRVDPKRHFTRIVGAATILALLAVFVDQLPTPRSVGKIASEGLSSLGPEWEKSQLRKKFSFARVRFS